MLPFPYLEITILGVEKTSSAAFAMAATGGGCNLAWNDLLTELAVTRIFTGLLGLGSIVFGMVPAAAIPAGAGTINAGCARDAAGGFVGLPSTFAHELGHLYQRPHVAVPGDPGNDAEYPNYGGDSRSIGEVGIDTGQSPPTLFDPATSDDIMSYGNNLWISPHTYRKILDARGMHQTAPADPRRVRPLLVFAVRLHRDARVEVLHASRVDAPGSVPRPWERAVSPLSVDLRDRAGRILLTYHCLHVPAHAGGECGGGCGPGGVPLDREPYLDMVEAVEWPGGVHEIAFHRGGEPLATLEVGEPPTLEVVGPDRREGRLMLSVHAEHPRQTPSVVVLFANDDESWLPVALDPPEGLVEVEAERLPGGERCRFRAVATAELQSAVADTEPFELPRSPRRVYVVTPSDDCGIPVGAVGLRALVDDRATIGSPPRKCYGVRASTASLVRAST